jgi:restriction system protein
MQPVLQALADTSTELPFVALMVDVASRLGLTPDELAERLPSGKETVFANRLHWALAYLERTGVVEQRHGVYFPVAGGWEAQPTVPSFRPEPKPLPPGAAEDGAAPSSVEGPEVLMEASARIIRQRLMSELLARIHGGPPEFFERLIIELLLAMGYGCGRELARHLGRRGDGGIDGAVPLDVLGLDVIYIQAKRYRPDVSVPVSAVREFAGSLDACKADKGVFVTTAAFPKSAWKFVSAVPCKIALIDGQTLADLMIGYNIGVKVRETFEVKEIDYGSLAGDAVVLSPRAGVKPAMQPLRPEEIN